MASAYVGSTFMPLLFGLVQDATTIKILPYYLLFFAFLCILLLEITYRVIPNPKETNEEK